MQCLILYISVSPPVIFGLMLPSPLFPPTELKTGAKVITISADFTKDDIYEGIKENIQGLDVAILGGLA